MGDPIQTPLCSNTDILVYIHWNPVKHGYVAPLSHRPYSSFHRYLKQGWLPAHWRSNIEPLNGADFGE
jgi:hypothetical protein